MITIEILNAKEVAEQKQGAFLATVAGLFVDLQAKVEEAVVEKIREALAKEGIRADIRRVEPE